MKNFKQWIIESGLAEEGEITGLLDSEIMDIEQKRNIVLPRDYKDFLSQCGRSAGLFGKDIDILYPNFCNLKEEFLEIAEEFGIEFRPPVNAFFFSAYQGGSFHYFLCSANDDRIYVLNEGDTSPTIVSDSFTLFMKEAISSYQDAFYQHPDKNWMH